MDLTLVVMAAGFGSRYGGIKQMDGVGPSGETLLEYAVYDAIRSGFKKVVFIIRPDIEKDFKERVSSKFEDKIEIVHVFQTLQNVPERFSINPERTKPLGTGHAVWCARNVIDGPFVIINADDFYGKTAYEKVYGFYNNPANLHKGSYCMVAYKLINTLSDHGSVNRGECLVNEEGYLFDVQERLNVEKIDDEKASYPDGGTINLNSPVSMNLWGFTTDFFELLEGKLFQFLEENQSELTKEFYIPNIVGELIREKLCKVKALETDAKWYGMTYPQDRVIVENAIKEMVKNDDYPENLWK